MTMLQQQDPYAAFKAAYMGSDAERKYGPLDQQKLNSNDFLGSLDNNLVRLLPSDRLTGFDTKRLAKLPPDDVVALVRQNPNLIGGFPSDYWKKLPASFVSQEVIPHLIRTDQQGLADEIQRNSLQAAGGGGSTYRIQSTTGAPPVITRPQAQPDFTVRPPSLGPALPPREPGPAGSGNEVPGSNDYPNNPIPRGTVAKPNQTGIGAPPPTTPKEPKAGDTQWVTDPFGRSIQQKWVPGELGVDENHQPIQLPGSWEDVPGSRYTPPGSRTATPRDAAAQAQDLAAADLARAQIQNLIDQGRRADAQVLLDRAKAVGIVDGQETLDRIQTLAQVKYWADQGDNLRAQRALDAAKAKGYIDGQETIEHIQTVAQVKYWEAQGDHLRAQDALDRGKAIGVIDGQETLDSIKTKADITQAGRQQDLAEGLAVGRFGGSETVGGRAQTLAEQKFAEDLRVNAAERTQALAEARFAAEQRANPSSIYDIAYASRGEIPTLQPPTYTPPSAPPPMVAAQPTQQGQPQGAPAGGNVLPPVIPPAAPASPVTAPPPLPAGSIGEQAAGGMGLPQAQVDPQLKQQYAEWVAAKRAAGEDPSDPEEFRQHVIRMGSPDPGDTVRGLFAGPSGGSVAGQAAAGIGNMQVQVAPDLLSGGNPEIRNPGLVTPGNSSGFTSVPSISANRSPYSVAPIQNPRLPNLAPPKPLTFDEIQRSGALVPGLKSAFGEGTPASYRPTGGVPLLSQQRLGQLTGTEQSILDAGLRTTGTDPNDYRQEVARLAATTTPSAGGRLRTAPTLRRVGAY